MAAPLMIWFKVPFPQRVRVNLNAITADGLLRVRGSRFHSPVKIGSLVTIVVPEDEIEGFARVVRINDRTDLVYLDAAWESLHDQPLQKTTKINFESVPPTPPQPAGRPRLVFAGSP